MKKKSKKKGNLQKIKPHTERQMTSIALGRTISWGFIIILILVALVFAICSGDGSREFMLAFMISQGAIMLIYGGFILLGMLLKIDCARCAAKDFLKIHRIDIREPYSAEDKKDCLTVGGLWVFFGVVLIVGAIFTV